MSLCTADVCCEGWVVDRVLGLVESMRYFTQQSWPMKPEFVCDCPRELCCEGRVLVTAQESWAVKPEFVCDCPRELCCEGRVLGLVEFV